MTTKDPAAGQPGRQRSHLFLVRLWRAEVDGGAEYRGSVRDVTSGAWRNFRDWSDVSAFMLTQVEGIDDPDRGHADQDV